ncbi:unnamed protein product [Schistocephalus solidus]|uniref:Cystatin domain-containing protein n=1 Tax=Schistocephalus solidus TaxID=70667 RepID=A0A183SMR1_SCHSO|nr:unnamed protein product [Schistocephalus solidus]
MEEVSQASPTRAAAITPPLAQSPCLGKENASPTMCQVGIRGPSKPGMPPDLNPVERETAINFASSTPTHPNLGPFNALFGKARNGAEKTQNAEIQQRVYEYLRMNDDIYYNIVTYTTTVYVGLEMLKYGSFGAHVILLKEDLAIASTSISSRINPVMKRE